MFGRADSLRESGAGSARRGATRSSMIETMSNESGRKSMTTKKPKKVFQMGSSKTNSLKPAVKKIGQARRTLGAWDDASSTGSRESFKRTMSAAEPIRKPSTNSEKPKSYAAKLIPKMHPKNSIKDLCLPGDYKNDEYQIKIGDKSFVMNFNDKIFTITEPCSHAQDETCCIFCEKTENLINCDFCGHKACEDCLYKKRKFQVNKSTTNEISVKTGQICKVCDRKFIMKSAFAQYSVIIDKQDQ